MKKSFVLCLGMLVSISAFAAERQKMIINYMDNPIQVTLKLDKGEPIKIDVLGNEQQTAAIPDGATILSAKVYQFKPARKWVPLSKDEELIWTFSGDPADEKMELGEYKEKYSALLNSPVSVFTSDRNPTRSRAFRLWTKEDFEDRKALKKLPGDLLDTMTDFILREDLIWAVSKR